jgi:hypothetical protein
METHTHEKTGYGARSTSWRQANARSLLKEIIEKNLKEPRDILFEIFAEQVRDDEGYLLSVIDYFFTNNCRSLTESPQRTVETDEERAARVEAMKAHIAANLMEIILPTGLSLRESTGADCKRAGGWFLKIAKVVPPRKKVGDVLDEKGVQELFGKRK